MSRIGLILLGGILFLLPTSLNAEVLSPDQSSWLKKHNATLLVRPERAYPPFSFVSANANARPKGLSVDYLDLVARKIGARASYLEPRSRASILSDIKSGKEGIVLALTETDERAEYLYFSEPYITLPTVIVTRKDYPRRGKELSLGDFEAKQVAITEGYEVMEYVKQNYPRIIVESVSDDEVGLQKLLLGEVDATITDLASLSYYTSHDMLSYVSIAGQTGFEYKLSFAIPKSMPELQDIVNAGLKEITPSERAIIKDRWITFPVVESSQNGFFSFLKTRLWVVVSVVAAVLLILILIIVIIHTRRFHHVRLRSLSNENRKDKKVLELSRELENLEAASSALTEDIAHIHELETSIQDKIDTLRK